MHKLICSVGMMIVALLAGALGARGQGLGPLGPPIVWQFDSARVLQELPGNRGVPWLSVDGKRLYYEDSSGFSQTERSAVGQRFGAPRPVRGLATTFHPSLFVPAFARYSDDERTVWYAGLSGRSGACFYGQYQAERASDTAAFANIRVLQSGYQTSCVSSLGAWLQFFTPTPDGQRAFACIGGDVDDFPLLELERVRPDTFLIVRSLACCRHGDWLRAESIQLLDSGRQLLMMANYAFPQPGSGLFLLSRPTIADTFGLPQPVQLPVLQHLPYLDISQAYYRPDIGVLVLALNQYRSNGAPNGARLWILEGQQRPQGIGEGNAPATFGLAPNPAHHTVRLTGLLPGATTAHIIDALGRTVQTSDLAPLTSNLSLTGLPPGLYTVRVGAATRRLVVE